MKITRDGDGFAIECHLVITADAEQGIKKLAQKTEVNPGDVVDVLLKKFADDVGADWRAGKRTFEEPNTCPEHSQ